jgi:hypothetical protein
VRGCNVMFMTLLPNDFCHLFVALRCDAPASFAGTSLAIRCYSLSSYPLI